MLRAGPLRTKDLHRVVELFKAHSGFAFGDATIAAYIGRENIEYMYLFDDDFDALKNVTRLETTDNSFS